MTFDELEDYVMNLGLNVSGFCNGDYSKSMPVSQKEWCAVVEWEQITGQQGSISTWIHTEDF